MARTTNRWRGNASPVYSMATMVHLIDALHLGSPDVICIALLECSPSELVIVDSGPECVFESVVEGVRKLGFRPEHVRHLLASHIHLDHSGGAWRWAKEFGTLVYVHPKGAPHLVNPSRLVESATRIYGDQMNYLWGKVGAIPEDHVIAVDDCAELRFGSCHVRVLHTPGHAQHHNAYWLESEQTLFAGDVAGVLIRGGPPIPPCPPPDIHLESWKESIAKIRTLKPTSLHVTHFGRVDNPAKTLDALEMRLSSWADWMKQRLLEGKSEPEIISEFQRFTDSELIAGGAKQADLRTYEHADPAFMSVAGLTRYWQKYHPEQVPQVGK